MLVTINGGELFTQFIHQLTRLTSSFAEGAAREESVSGALIIIRSFKLFLPLLQVCAEDRRYMEAFEFLLEAWVTVLQNSHLYPKDFCKQSAIDIFNTYLRCHLAPPDGTRGQVGVITPVSIYHKIISLTMNGRRALLHIMVKKCWRLHQILSP
jgi:hypothetical protein